MDNCLFCLISEDVLLKIFSFFTLKDLQTASKVCKTWLRVSRDSFLWSSLNLQPYSTTISEETLLDILKTTFAPLGRKLSLSEFNVSSNVIQFLFRECKHLHTLDLRTCRFQITTGHLSVDCKSLKQIDLRDVRGFSLELESVLEQADGLECLGMYCCFPSRISQSVFSNKPRLRILDCSQCDWLIDDFVDVIARNCPQLEYLSLARCYNYIGYSLKTLLKNCHKLRTLLLTGTRIDDSSLTDADWRGSNISSLDIQHCARVSHVGVTAVLSQISRLRYLKCALTEENCRALQHKGFPYVETLQINRRFPIIIDNAASLLIGCPMITCLDISSIPFSHVHFKAFLPSMPQLKYICIAANEISGTNHIIDTLADCNPSIHHIWIIYYHCNERDNIIDAFIRMASNCKCLKKVNLTGLYVSDFLKQLQFDVESATGRIDIEFMQNQIFPLPQPEYNLDDSMKF